MSLDWQDLYERMKTRYNTLYEQRVYCVEEDNHMLLNKIREYQECHRIAMEELNFQNDELQKELQSRKAIKQKLYSTQNSIDKIRSELGRKDPILKTMFKDRSFKLINLNDMYTFEVEASEPFVFKLKYDNNTSTIKYKPENIPKWLIDSDFTHILEFDFKDLDKFCNRILSCKINYDR